MSEALDGCIGGQRLGERAQVLDKIVALEQAHEAMASGGYGVKLDTGAFY